MPTSLRTLIHALPLALLLAAGPVLSQTDLVVVNDFNGTGGFNRVCRNDGAGTFTCGFVTDNTDRRRSHDVAAADFDDDGDDDLAFANVAGSGISAVNRICFNTGPGTFTCNDVSPDLDNSEGVAAADLDGDGDVDLAFANRGPGDDGAVNRACFNDGSGAFTCVDVSPDADESDGVAAVDLDDDGDADLVFANGGPGTAGDVDRMCLNDGSGAFACVDVSSDAGSSTSVGAADLDGDGDADLVFTNFFSGVRFCLNDGAAAFSCADVSSDGGDTYAVAPADYDGDGDLDLAFANPISNDQNRTNTICFNDGAAVFTCNSVSPDTDHSRDVATADFDADGDADLLFVNEQFFSFTNAQEQLCLNDGSGAFTCAYFAAGAAPDDDSYAVVVGNFSGMPLAAEAPGPETAGLTLAAFPNPARETTTIRLTLDAPQAVTVGVYDALGRRVALLHDGPLGAGTHALTLNASALPAGVYVLRASAGGTARGERSRTIVTKRLAVVR